jgi:uncharacterized protein YutE (UPF0331/DUF86 family)
MVFLRNELDYLRAEREIADSFKEFSENYRLKRAVERSLHVAIEACLDVGRRVIALEGFRFPDDNKDVFRILASEKVIPAELMESMLKMAGFRNIIVHEYTKIDDLKVYVALKRNLGDFENFSKAIERYLRDR